MPHRELNNANAVKRMTDFLAFGIIFAIACTKGIPDFTKETIKRQ